MSAGAVAVWGMCAWWCRINSDCFSKLFYLCLTYPKMVNCYPYNTHKSKTLYEFSCLFHYGSYLEKQLTHVGYYKDWVKWGNHMLKYPGTGWPEWANTNRGWAGLPNILSRQTRITHRWLNISFQHKYSSSCLEFNFSRGSKMNFEKCSFGNF